MGSGAAIYALLAVVGVGLLDAVVHGLLRRRESQRTVEPPSGSRLLRACRILVNLVGFACFGAVAASGLILLFGKQDAPGGDRLLAHVMAAGSFALAALAVALLWMDRNRFRASDGGRIFEPVVLRKIFFWIAFALAIPTLISILLAMFPLATPSQQQSLYVIHRSCALLLAGAGLLFAWFALVSWREHSPE